MNQTRDAGETDLKSERVPPDFRCARLTLVELTTPFPVPPHAEEAIVRSTPSPWGRRRLDAEVDNKH